MAKNKNPPCELQKSIGHVCFARRGTNGHDRVEPEQVTAGDVEFYVDDAGTCLHRAAIDSPFSADRRTGVAVLTGIAQIRDACRTLGCRVPDATAKEEEKRAAAYAARHPKSEEQIAAASATAIKPQQAAKPAKKERQVMKGKTSNLTLVDMWERLFIENEKAAKKNKKTDKQLIAIMRKEFPDAGESTTGRPRMYRSCYNAGTYMYLKRDKAGGKDRPLSHEYDDAGEPVSRGRGRPADAKAGKGKPSKAGKTPGEKPAAKPAKVEKPAKSKPAPKPKPKTLREKTAAAEQPFEVGGDTEIDGGDDGVN